MTSSNGKTWCRNVAAPASTTYYHSDLHLQCVLQCVAVHCSVLQCVAICCRVLQSAVECCSVLQCVAVCYSDTVCCSVLQSHGVASGCSMLRCVAMCCSVLQFVAVCCSVLLCVAVCCCVLQCVAVCYLSLSFGLQSMTTYPWPRIIRLCMRVSVPVRVGELIYSGCVRSKPFTLFRGVRWRLESRNQSASDPSPHFILTWT